MQDQCINFYYIDKVRLDSIAQGFKINRTLLYGCMVNFLFWYNCSKITAIRDDNLESFFCEAFKKEIRISSILLAAGILENTKTKNIYTLALLGD